MSKLIDRIVNATWYPDVCQTADEYKFLAKLLHPDKNSDSRAAIAFAHINELKEAFERGYEFCDESGEYRSNYLYHRWLGDKTLLEQSKESYEKLLLAAKSIFDASSFNHFMQYLPSQLMLSDGVLFFTTNKKSMPLSKAIKLLPESEKNKHINWIYSRMIEFIAMLEALGVAHAGLNPDSVFIEPETHTITIASFYHVCTVDVKTICGRYKSYYPQLLFDTKQAGAYIDIALAKKTAICALGDASGSGVKLRADSGVNQNVLNYLLASDYGAIEAMRDWRLILNENFVKEFVVLDI